MPSHRPYCWPMQLKVKKAIYKLQSVNCLSDTIKKNKEHFVTLNVHLRYQNIIFNGRLAVS